MVVRVREKIETGRKWPTKRQQAANGRAYDARQAERAAALEALAEQLKTNGRCDHGPQLLQAEGWEWKKKQWDWTQPNERLIYERTHAICWHYRDGRLCPHYWTDNCMPSCRLLHATDRELLPPWARSDEMSDEEWTEKLQQWVRTENERERREKADRPERRIAGGIGSTEAYTGPPAGEAPGTATGADKTTTADAEPGTGPGGVRNGDAGLHADRRDG